jgi:acyl-CoA thioester hydrolase
MQWPVRRPHDGGMSTTQDPEARTESTSVTSPTAFTARMSVRLYELDMLGHLNDAVYVQWADHVRALCAAAAGASVRELGRAGIAPVNLETTIRYHHELREGDEVDVSCAFEWGAGKTVRVNQEFRRTDGTLAAELTSVAGLFVLRDRRLAPDPVAIVRSMASRPEVMGLPPEGAA